MEQKSQFKTTALLCVCLLLIPLPGHAQEKHADYPISMVDIKKVELTDSFWLPKIRTVQRTTIAYGFQKCDEEGRLESFLIAGKKKQGKVRGKFPFDDSDIYKVIEGASLSLISAPNRELDTYLDSIIAIVKIGQEPDGYITTWFTIDPTNPISSWVPKTGARWTREQSSHELYNSGHMFEAAVAHYTATGKRNFLDIAVKNADLLVENFGSGKLTIPPGHQIIETGLIKLYRVTGNEKYLTLAKQYLDWRGDSTTHTLYGEYSQDHKPVTQQDEIVGHAVRAVYMYAGMTDIAALYNDSLYLNAVMRIWQNMVERKMYLTGGIGAKHEGEALGKDYELPNLTAYGETCASIGDVFWNARLFMLSGDAKYFDVIERTLYNGLISGLSLDGKKFFYTNPLEADGIFKFNEKTNTRQPWFDCSCCPTNLIRFVPSLPGLIYAAQRDTLYVNLYASNKADVKLENSSVNIEQQTEYPWSGSVNIQINPDKTRRFTLKVRIPSWAQNKVLPGDLYLYSHVPRGTVTITLNGKELEYDTHQGYAAITRSWQKGDSVGIHFPMNVRRVVANERVKDDVNLTALECGPLVYCVEGIDNESRVADLAIPDDAVFRLEKRNELLGGVNVITGNARSRVGSKELKLTAIPYYAWSNRGVGTMKVWLPRK
ncbi:MAG: glycoside hydrolase family 127 protein [Ignavibacteriae bacterium]|nr:glycoside hydrolase family 127 protein [Ignavibacteriota bacterium]